MSTIEHDASGQRFSTEVDGFRAHLDYTLTGNVMNIMHTRVPDQIGGRGIAATLTRAALEAAREAGWKVNAVCSYAAAYLARHPEETPKEHMDALLDEALDESYPASDPPAVGSSD
ncbi:MAG TPA: GNAT family N-acetyltransferase [Steroidobacteraceae bacterium]|jgi:hypothetical protein|nr:GNAT family N-acetyltransferase [Steroidobacteraceae bacterium]